MKQISMTVLVSILIWSAKNKGGVLAVCVYFPAVYLIVCCAHLLAFAFLPLLLIGCDCFATAGGSFWGWRFCISGLLQMVRLKCSAQWFGYFLKIVKEIVIVYIFRGGGYYIFTCGAVLLLRNHAPIFIAESAQWLFRFVVEHVFFIGIFGVHILIHDVSQQLIEGQGLSRFGTVDDISHFDGHGETHGELADGVIGRH